jgi:hypothetical protein
MEEKITKRRVTLDELGLYLRTIELDYKPQDNQERADLISQFFNVLCYKEDVDHYEQLSHRHQEYLQQDWELESRREEYFKSLNIINPFN